MAILKLTGAGMMILGCGASAIILLDSFGIRKSGVEFWFLFLLCFAGGAILYGLGCGSGSVRNVLKAVGATLLLLGLISASSIFLAKIGVAEVKSFGSLWALFLLCTPIGAWAAFVADLDGV
jgi:hypothetical protein